MVRAKRRRVARDAFRTCLLGITILGVGTGGQAADQPGNAMQVVDLGPVAIGSPIAPPLYLMPRDPAGLAAFVTAVQPAVPPLPHPPAIRRAVRAA